MSDLIWIIATAGGFLWAIVWLEGKWRERSEHRKRMEDEDERQILAFIRAVKRSSPTGE
jgi:hypothetical protein